MENQLAEIIAPYKDKKGALIPILQKVQEKLGYISEEAVDEVARFLRISSSEVFGVASFYSQFRFTPHGEHVIRVCQGTACRARGGMQILQEISHQLDIQPESTTSDGKFSLQRSACFGACVLAPVMAIDENIYGKMTPTKVRRIISNFSMQKGQVGKS